MSELYYPRSPKTPIKHVFLKARQLKCSYFEYDGDIYEILEGTEYKPTGVTIDLYPPLQEIEDEVYAILNKDINDNQRNSGDEHST